MDVSLKKANEHRNEWFEGVHKCKLDETLFTIMEKIVRAEVHRLVVVDDDDKVIGIISLSDLLLYLVLRPCGEDGSPEGVSSVRSQDILLHENSTQSVDSEISETILEEEEHVEQMDEQPSEQVAKQPDGRILLEERPEQVEKYPEQMDEQTDDQLANTQRKSEDDDGLERRNTEDSDSSLPEMPLLDKSSLSNENPIFREVTVTGGE